MLKSVVYLRKYVTKLAGWFHLKYSKLLSWEDFIVQPFPGTDHMGLNLILGLLFSFSFQRRICKLSECKHVINIPEVKNLIFQSSAPGFFWTYKIRNCTDVIKLRNETVSLVVTVGSLALRVPDTQNMQRLGHQSRGRNRKVLFLLLSALIVDKIAFSSCSFLGGGYLLPLWKWRGRHSHLKKNKTHKKNPWPKVAGAVHAEEKQCETVQ